jgi:hypothetical protein
MGVLGYVAALNFNVPRAHGLPVFRERFPVALGGSEEGEAVSTTIEGKEQAPRDQIATRKERADIFQLDLPRKSTTPDDKLGRINSGAQGQFGDARNLLSSRFKHLGNCCNGINIIEKVSHRPSSATRNQLEHLPSPPPTM